MLRFFLSMNPPTVTQQEHRLGVSKNGKPFVYEDARLADAREKLMDYLYEHKPPEPLSGPLILSCVWRFNNKGKHKDGAWKTSKPDTDNLNKMLKDCMTRLGFWLDDAQVCMEDIRKVWSDVPGIMITVAELKET